MKPVNYPTQMLLDVFRQKSEKHSGPEFNEGHPYFSAVEAAQMIDVPTDDDKFREATIQSLHLWCGITIAKMIGEVISEIATVGKIASKGDPKERAAANELLMSMEFIQGVMQAWANSIDLEHIAEFVFEDGRKRYEAAVASGHPSAIFSGEKKTPEEAIAEIRERMEAVVEKHQQPKEEKKPVKKSGPPVTPEDIMKLLFEKHTNPSVN